MAKAGASLGIIKNKTSILKKTKEEIRDKQTRFQKKDKGGLNDFINEKPVPNGPLLASPSNQATSETIIEMKSQNPQWYSCYETTLFQLQELNNIKKKLHDLEIKRIKDAFGDVSKLDLQITELTSQATKKLRECEKNLNYIKVQGEAKESYIDEKVRVNIVRSLATQIQDFASIFRKQQKNYFDKLKNLDNDQGGKFLQLSQEKIIEMKDDYVEEAMDDIEMLDDIVKERDEGINKLIETINELTHLFKQLNNIVIEQGTILDRIEFNILETKKNTEKAKQELIKGEEYQKSSRSRCCIFLLIILIIIFGIILVLKYTNHR